MKTKAAMVEGPEALGRFQRTMKALFRVPKEKVNGHGKPQGKKRARKRK